MRNKRKNEKKGEKEIECIHQGEEEEQETTSSLSKLRPVKVVADSKSENGFDEIRRRSNNGTVNKRPVQQNTPPRKAVTRKEVVSVSPPDTTYSRNTRQKVQQSTSGILDMASEDNVSSLTSPSITGSSKGKRKHLKSNTDGESLTWSSDDENVTGKFSSIRFSVFRIICLR